MLLLAVATHCLAWSGARAQRIVYRNKDNGQLFQYSQWLTLFGNHTFTYASRSCLGYDTCYGTWDTAGDKLRLHTDRNLKTLAARADAGSWQSYTDLGSRQYQFYGECVIYKDANGFRDTLRKR